VRAIVFHSSNVTNSSQCSDLYHDGDVCHLVNSLQLLRRRSSISLYQDDCLVLFFMSSLVLLAWFQHQYAELFVVQTACTIYRWSVTVHVLKTHWHSANNVGKNNELGFNCPPRNNGLSLFLYGLILSNYYNNLKQYLMETNSAAKSVQIKRTVHEVARKKFVFCIIEAQWLMVSKLGLVSMHD